MTNTQDSHARDSMFLVPSEKPRLSTADSSSTGRPSAEKSSDVNKIMSAVARMDEPQLQQQRFDLDPEKENELAELEIMTKLERALSRRLNDQAAVFTSTARSHSAASTGAASSSMSKEVLV